MSNSIERVDLCLDPGPEGLPADQLTYANLNNGGLLGVQDERGGEYRLARTLPLVSMVLRNEELFQVGNAKPGDGFGAAEIRPRMTRESEHGGPIYGGLLGMDNPCHDDASNLIARFMKPKAYESLGFSFRQIAAEQANEFAVMLQSPTGERPCIVRDYVDTIHMRMVTRLLGCNPSEWERIVRISGGSFKEYDSDGDPYAEARALYEDLADFTGNLIQSKREDHDGSLFDQMVVEVDKKRFRAINDLNLSPEMDQQLHDASAINTLANFITGTTTTMSMIANILIRLRAYPTNAAKFMQFPYGSDKRWQSCRGEIMKYIHEGDLFGAIGSRIATRDITVVDEYDPTQEEKIFEGEAIVPSLAAAVSDPRGTGDMKQIMLAWGAGTHFCPFMAESMNWIVSAVLEFEEAMAQLKGTTGRPVQLVKPIRDLPWSRNTVLSSPASAEFELAA